MIFIQAGIIPFISIASAFYIELVNVVCKNALDIPFFTLNKIY